MAPAVKQMLVTHAHDRDNIKNVDTEALKPGKVAPLEQCLWACVLHHTTSVGPERMKRRRHCEGVESLRGLGLRAGLQGLHLAQGHGHKAGTA